MVIMACLEVVLESYMRPVRSLGHIRMKKFGFVFRGITLVSYEQELGFSDLYCLIYRD